MPRRRYLSSAEEIVVAAIRIMYRIHDYRINGDFVLDEVTGFQVRFRARKGYCLRISEEKEEE